jgi:hypothetical protein
MNLDNLNLVELNAQEVQEVDGGFWVEVLVGTLIDQWGSFKQGLSDGYHATHH